MNNLTQNNANQTTLGPRSHLIRIAAVASAHIYPPPVGLARGSGKLELQDGTWPGWAAAN